MHHPERQCAMCEEYKSFHSFAKGETVCLLCCDIANPEPTIIYKRPWMREFGEPCQEPGCENFVHNNKNALYCGVCSNKRHDAKRRAERKAQGPCSEPDCNNRSFSEGKCRQHFNAVHPPVRQKGPCSEDGCTERSFCKGLCRPHYHSARKKQQRDSKAV